MNASQKRMHFLAFFPAYGCTRWELIRQATPSQKWHFVCRQDIEWADQRGLLEQREPCQALCRGLKLRPGSLGHAEVHCQPEQVRRLLRLLLPQCRPAQCHGGLRPEGACHGGGDPALLRGGACQRPGRLLRLRARAHCSNQVSTSGPATAPLDENATDLCMGI